MVGVPRALRVLVMPVAAAWSVAVAAVGAASAIGVGIAVRTAPVLRPRPELAAELSELATVCSLVSDTHLVAPGAVPEELAIYPAQWPRRELPARGELLAGLARVLRDVRRHGPRTVIWCGDEVDTGLPAEWAGWREVVDAVPGLAHRIVPGNHDICFNRPFDEDHLLARRAQRERAFQEQGPRLADYPIVDTIISAQGAVHVALLDSCRRRSKHVLSNAIGELGEVQLAELDRLLANLRGPLLVVAHHHMWRDARFLDPEAWFETAVDAGALVALLERYRRRGPTNRVLICHGHRHAATLGTVGEDCAVVGLPSTTLGDKSRSPVLDGVVRYTVAGLRRDGSWGIAMRELGPL